MTANEAITIVRTPIHSLFADDGAQAIGLDEFRFDDQRGRWVVTIGFTRSWEAPQGAARWTQGDGRRWPRTFKTVKIADADGRVVDLRHWPVAA